MIEDIVSRLRKHVMGKDDSIQFLPVTEEAVREAEVSLGFGIPVILRAIYLNVGNGGFGPGYGVIGLKEGRPSNLGTLVGTYRAMQAGARYLGMEWKAGLLPFCEWGCNIFSCVDCNDTHSRIYQSEECKVHKRNYALCDFFGMWLDGTDILGTGRAPRASAEITNPFTGKNTRARGENR